MRQWWKGMALSLCLLFKPQWEADAMLTHAESEIFSQPEIWQQTADMAQKYSELLPQTGERVAFVGCGTSWFMSMAAAARREGLGLGESDAFAASEFARGRKYDRVVVVSRSGTTTEVLDLLRELEGQNTVALTAVAGAPITALARHSVVLDFADEKSVLQTRYATAVLALLRTHFGDNLQPAIQQCRDALDWRIPRTLVEAEQISFLGTGWTVGLAHEAALKTRESAQFWAEAYPAMDYRHGPISIAQPGRVVWIFGTPPDGLIEDVKVTGATIETFHGDPMSHLVAAQRVAVAISTARGLDTDNPRFLSRSIVLK